GSTACSTASCPSVRAAASVVAVAAPASVKPFCGDQHRAFQRQTLATMNQLVAKLARMLNRDKLVKGRYLRHEIDTGVGVERGYLIARNPSKQMNL
ncbi:MAG: hypothetical protein AAF384_18770, partial [Pseudomonadota bacterium]